MKDLRARGEATVVVNEKSLPWGRASSGEFGRAEVQADGTSAQPARVPEETPLPQA